MQFFISQNALKWCSELKTNNCIDINLNQFHIYQRMLGWPRIGQHVNVRNSDWVGCNEKSCIIIAVASSWGCKGYLTNGDCHRWEPF